MLKQDHGIEYIQLKLTALIKHELNDAIKKDASIQGMNSFQILFDIKAAVEKGVPEAGMGVLLNKLKQSKTIIDFGRNEKPVKTYAVKLNPAEFFKAVPDRSAVYVSPSGEVVYKNKSLQLGSETKQYKLIQLLASEKKYFSYSHIFNSLNSSSNYNERLKQQITFLVRDVKQKLREAGLTELAKKFKCRNGYMLDA